MYVVTWERGNGLVDRRRARCDDAASAYFLWCTLRAAGARPSVLTAAGQPLRPEDGLPGLQIALPMPFPAALPQSGGWTLPTPAPAP